MWIATRHRTVRTRTGARRHTHAPIHEDLRHATDRSRFGRLEHLASNTNFT